MRRENNLTSDATGRNSDSGEGVPKRETHASRQKKSGSLLGQNRKQGVSDFDQKQALAQSSKKRQTRPNKGAAQDALTGSANAWSVALGVDRDTLLVRLTKANAVATDGKFKARDVFGAIFTPKDVLQTQKAQAELDEQLAKNEEKFGRLVDKSIVEESLWADGLAIVRESWLGYRNAVAPTIRSILQNIDPALVERVIDAAAAGVEQPLSLLQDSMKKK